MATDPVCGMSVDPVSAAGRFDHAGRTYYFCSGSCLSKFKADPARYAPSGGGAGRWVFWGFVLIAAFFLISEHRAHVFQYLPILLLLGCAVMHLFHGHGSHGDHGGHGGHTRKESDEPKR